METTRVLGVFSEAQKLLYQCNIDTLWSWVDGTGRGDLSLVPRTHVKKSDMVACAYNPSPGWGVGAMDP